MSIWAIILVIILTFGCTWIVLSCLWAASEADRKEEETNDNDGETEKKL